MSKATDCDSAILGLDTACRVVVFHDQFAVVVNVARFFAADFGLVVYDDRCHMPTWH